MEQEEEEEGEGGTGGIEGTGLEGKGGVGGGGRGRGFQMHLTPFTVSHFGLPFTGWKARWKNFVVRKGCGDSFGGVRGTHHSSGSGEGLL
ncbi:hypothetical protein E2C01_070093 [Portunus trituberculatus]|uniref:Uncharacterized protein n=1 Tax=Portunus trituberculatus TaxID=210409 RepID=A0A5B7HTB1_PORTR|nr:hypothetical protein [Portunus trituberculatus]